MLLLWSAPAAHGDPADIFQVGAPVIGSDPPKAADIQIGDSRVATQTGSFEYGYPIPVPPGRNGMQPHLSLAYSSQAAIYGGIANGWSLSIPTISLDTSAGRLWMQDSGVKRYVSSMAGGRVLVGVDEPHAGDVTATYRAKNDDSFTRYERLSGDFFPGSGWRARTLDGSTYLFGDRTHTNGSFTGTPGCTTISDENAPLTSVIDRFGNAVDYYWEAGATGECRIAVITWGENAVASISDFARVTFNYTPSRPPAGCPPGTLVGAQSSYRSGQLIVTGASQLDSIVATSYALGQPSSPTYTRTIALSYAPDPVGDPGVEQTASCTATHAAYRTLYSIHESATGDGTTVMSVDLPAVKFTYGSAQFGTGSLAWNTTTRSNPWSSITAIPNGGANFNLGWGYRFNDPTNRWPTVEAMMLDIDGDGLVDRLFNSPYTDSAGKYHCRAQWLRNRGGLEFETSPRDIPMPQLKWATQDMSCANPNRYDGSPTPRPDEACSLNYQRTAYANTPDSAFVTCKTQLCTSTSGTGYCPDPLAADYGVTCSALPSRGPTYLAFRWMDVDGDGLTDLVASPATGSVYNLEQGTGLCGDTPPAEPEIFGHFPRTCPTAPYGVTINQGASTGPYTVCQNMYPWMVYRNHGNGQFGEPGADPTLPLPDTIIYQPTPLESDAGDSSLNSLPIGQQHGTADLDGDGLPDGIGVPAASSTWSVFRNDLSGRFSPTSASTAFSFPADSGSIAATDYVTDPSGYGFPVSTAGLFDLNGDGLVEHWSGSGSATTFAPNDGASFQSFGATTSTVRPGNDGYLSCYGGCSSEIDHRIDPHTGHVLFTTYWIEAQRWDASRVLDADLDGRSDVVQFLSGTQTPGTYLNQGGGLTPTAFASVGDTTSVRHKMVATDQMASPAYTWEVRADQMDLDGDGIPEGLSFADHDSGISTFSVSKIDTPTQPPRLLVGIDNQRGAKTSVSYAAMSNGAVVVRDPGIVMPRTGWVVQSVTSDDSVASTHPTTTYQYKNPHFSVEGDLTRDNGDLIPKVPLVSGPSQEYRFRGFDEVTATNIRGAATTQKYDYSIDWSGRLETTLVMSAEAPSMVSSIDETTWGPQYLFCDPHAGCASKTYHPAATDHWTCSNNQDESTCRNLGARTHTVPTYSAIASTVARGPALLIAETSSRLQASVSPDEGDRVTDTSYLLASDSTDYRLFPQTVTESVIQNGAPVTFAKTSHALDNSNIVEVTDEVWVDNSDANRAITRRVYDMTTGSVLQRRRPKQEDPAVNGPYATYGYDARKLFPTSETDELGNVFNYTYDYGTGTKLETQGPNAPTCAATNNCPQGTLTKQSHRITIDGLGRTLQTWQTFGDTISAFTPYEIGIDSYDDTHIPNSVTHQGAIAVDSSGVVSYTTTTTEIDGHGRPTKSTNFVGGSAPTNAVTTYQYADDGTLTSVTVPDPTANDASTVTYRYGYDSLGRPTSFRRPDTSVLANQSGVDMSYDGLTTTTAEVVAGADDKPATTRTTKDAFGRLVLVEEAQSGAPIMSWARTSYGYDAADRVAQITDPESIVTNIGYDFAGHRTTIARVSGTWTFTYDKDGNLWTEAVPNTCAPNDGPCAARYLTTFVYDALDRITSKILAPRELTSSDLALFAADTETYTWDFDPVDHNYYRETLTKWAAWGPNHNTTGAQSLEWRKDGDGEERLTQLVSTFGGLSISKYVVDNYALNGAIKAQYFHDSVGGTNESTSTTTFDARGLPSSMTYTIEGVVGSPRTIAVQTRNVAGLVTKRRTDQTGAMPFIESDWTYDKLGRVTSQLVQKGPGSVRVAEQDLSYFGNDDPKTLDVYLGNNHKQFAFTYDTRHQLLTANETTTSGYFSATYGYGNAGRFASANVQAPSPGPGSEVAPRNVTYQYQGTDPEEVTALLSGATPFVGYAYDASGNMTGRCTGGYVGSCSGESMEYLYDGQDQLRRATKKVNGVVQSSEEYWYGEKEQRTATLKRDAAGNKTELILWLRGTEAHYDGTGALQHVYSYLSLGTPVARIDRTGNTTATVEFQFHGLADNTLAAVDSGGAVNASFSYAPFGEIVEASDGGGTSGVSAHRRRMNDKYVDEVSSLAYYGARYYDKTSMTWTQGDPLYRFAPDAAWKQPRKANLYTINLNNPLRYRDPDGRSVAATAGRVLVEVGEGIGIAAAGPLTVVIVAVGTTVVASSMTNGDATADEGNGCGSHGECMPPPDVSRQEADPPPSSGPTPNPPGTGKLPAPNIPNLPGPGDSQGDKDAARPRGAGRGPGERNIERRNPNPSKYQPKRDPGSPTGWSRRHPQTGKKIPVPPPADPPADDAPDGDDEQQNAGASSSSKQSGSRGGESKSKKPEPEQCGIECVQSF